MTRSLSFSVLEEVPCQLALTDGSNFRKRNTWEARDLSPSQARSHHPTFLLSNGFANSKANWALSYGFEMFQFKCVFSLAKVLPVLRGPWLGLGSHTSAHLLLGGPPLRSEGDLRFVTRRKSETADICFFFSFQKAIYLAGPRERVFLIGSGGLPRGTDPAAG